MKQQILVSVPDATDFAQIPAPIQELFQHIGVEIPPGGWTMPGTRVHEGRRLCHFMSAATPATIEWFVSILNAAGGFGWTVEAAQNFKTPPIIDPVTEEITGYGGVHKKAPLSLVDYLNDVMDGETPVRPIAPCAMHTFAGADQWMWDV